MARIALNPLPDLAILNARYAYDPNTGLFVHKTTAKHVKIGSIAGCKSVYGYITLKINGVGYYAHRIAWYMYYSVEPDSSLDIDHINGIRSDNRICNLRLVTRSQNTQNLKTAKTDKNSRLLGVHFMPRINKYVARIGLNGVRYYLGVYETKEHAYEVYLDAKRKLHTHGTL